MCFCAPPHIKPSPNCCSAWQPPTAATAPAAARASGATPRARFARARTPCRAVAPRCRKSRSGGTPNALAIPLSAAMSKSLFDKLRHFLQIVGRVLQEPIDERDAVAYLVVRDALL